MGCLAGRLGLEPRRGKSGLLIGGKFVSFGDKLGSLVVILVAVT